MYMNLILRRRNREKSFGIIKKGRSISEQVKIKMKFKIRKITIDFVWTGRD